MITKETDFAVDMSPVTLKWAIYNFPLANRKMQGTAR